MAQRSPHQKKRFRMRLRDLDTGLLKLAAVVIALAVAGLLFGPKMYRSFRDGQIDANIDRAEVALRAKDWLEARGLARSVLIARPGEFRAFRIYHKASAAINDPQTYIASVQLFVDKRSSTDDKLDAFRVLCYDAPQAVALSAFAYLPPEIRSDIRFRAAVVPLLLHRGDIKAAEGILRESTDLESSPEGQLQLIRVLCAYPTPERVAESRNILADLIAKNHPEGLEGILLLGNVKGGLDAGDPLPNLSSWVNSQADAKTIHHFYALHPQLIKAPTHPEIIFQPVVDRFLSVDPGAVGNWLVSHEQASLAIEILEPYAKSVSSAYIERTRALMNTERFAELDGAIASPPPSVDLVDLEIIKTAIAVRRKDSAGVTAGWDRVLQQAAFDHTRNRFLEINQFASLLGIPKVADDAMVAAIRIGWGRIPLYKDITPLLLRLANANRTVDLLAIYRTMLRFEPEDPELLNNYVYLAMLHELLPPSEAIARLDALVAKHPELPQVNSSLALACLLNKEPQRALDLINQHPPSEAFSENLQNAIKGGALLDLGKDEEGSNLIAKVEWSSLFHKETSALRSYLSQLKVRGLVLPEAPPNSAIENPEDTAVWRKAVEALERQRAHDVLPALPPPKMPSAYELTPDKPTRKVSSEGETSDTTPSNK
jgi:hypothetical protein